MSADQDISCPSAQDSPVRPPGGCRVRCHNPGRSLKFVGSIQSERRQEVRLRLTYTLLMHEVLEGEEAALARITLSACDPSDVLTGLLVSVLTNALSSKDSQLEVPPS